MSKSVTHRSQAPSSSQAAQCFALVESEQQRPPKQMDGDPQSSSSSQVSPAIFFGL
jgi:hypothetical protein